MTFAQWLEHASRTKAAIPNLRWGQTLFNTLVDVRPDIAERIRGTSLDPFYDDWLVGAFLLEVERLWD